MRCSRRRSRGASSSSSPGDRSSRTCGERLDSLTQREREVLVMLARGNEQRRAGRRAVRHRGHDQDTRVQPAGQARPARPRAGRRPGLRERAGQAGARSPFDREPRAPKICGVAERGRALRAMTGAARGRTLTESATPPPQGVSCVPRRRGPRPLQALRRRRRRQQSLVRHRGRPRHRLPRPERRRQEHDAARAARARAPLVGLRHVRRPALRGARAALAPTSARCSRTRPFTRAAAPATTCGSSPSPASIRPAASTRSCRRSGSPMQPTAA